MTLPEWVESVTGLIGKLTATPIKMSKRAVDAAMYLGVSFTAAVTSLWDEGLATPLRELSDSKLQKIKSLDIADAAEAHNKALLTRRQAEETKARAVVFKSKAEVNKAKARRIDGELELKRMREQRRLAQAQKEAAQARLRAGIAKLEAKGGKLYLDPPRDPRNEAGPMTPAE